MSEKLNKASLKKANKYHDVDYISKLIDANDGKFKYKIIRFYKSHWKWLIGIFIATIALFIR